MENDSHFDKVYWFVIGVVAFAAFLSVYVISIDRTHIAMVLTFWLSSGASGCIGYLIGSSIEKKKQAEPGTATVDISATATTEKKEP